MACGRQWCLRRPADLESLWEALAEDEFAADERLPYWVELWPASLALAEWLRMQRKSIAGSLCLDLGCGLGFTAMVASWLGAGVIGIDYEPVALSYARRNAAVNGVPQPRWVAMDWRFPAVRPRSCSFIWGGDIMYEKRFVVPVCDFLEHALAPGGRVWVAEPSRNVYALFSRTLAERGWQSRQIMERAVEALHTQKHPVSVKLWELSRVSAPVSD